MENEKNVAITEKRTLQPNELRQIIQYADELEKAYFTILATSGMRIEELTKMTFNDIKDRLITIQYDTAKNSKPRFTCITTEAEELLNDYLKQRNKYIITMCKKSFMVREQLKKVHLFINLNTSTHPCPNYINYKQPSWF